MNAFFRLPICPTEADFPFWLAILPECLGGLKVGGTAEEDRFIGVAASRELGVSPTLDESATALLVTVEEEEVVLEGVGLSAFAVGPAVAGALLPARLVLACRLCLAPASRFNSRVLKSGHVFSSNL